MKRKQVWKDVIRHALRESVHRMEGVARKWSRHYPLMMHFVKPFVYFWVVQAAVDPIDEEIRKCDEERELKKIIARERRTRRVIIEFCVATNFGQE